MPEPKVGQLAFINGVLIGYVNRVAKRDEGSAIELCTTSPALPFSGSNPQIGFMDPKRVMLKIKDTKQAIWKPSTRIVDPQGRPVKCAKAKEEPSPASSAEPKSQTSETTPAARSAGAAPLIQKPAQRTNDGSETSSDQGASQMRSNDESKASSDS